MVEVPRAISANLPPLIDVGRHYERAPIVEAIIELRCHGEDAVRLDDLMKFAEGRSQWDTPDRVFAVQGRLDVGEASVSSQTSHETVGLNYRRADGARVSSVHLDRFGFSWLPPYDTWERLLEEAEAEWLHYRRIARPSTVTRLGVRFINRIDVPSAAIEIRDYLRTTADVSNYLPQSIHGYFMQVALPLDSFDASCQITTATIPADTRGTSLILDIDTWQEHEIDLRAESASEQISTALHTLRFAKNYVFEACITDATRGLIS